MPEKVTNISGGAVLFVVFLVLAAIFVVSPETRAKILEVIEYVYGEIRCLIFSECAKTEDDTTAIESTKALACAIDATAYWSDTAKSTELTNCLKDIEEYNKDPATYVPKFCKNIFQKIDGTLFAASCKDGKTEPTPTGSAISTNSGSILSKLIGWSGGGNKITGNTISNQDAGNIITGHVSATPTTCTIHESTTTLAINTCTDIPKGAVTQVWHCDSKAKAQNCGNKIAYTELTSAIKTHDICQPSTGCKKVECSICGGTPTDWCYENECTGATSISKNRESLGIGTCKFVDNWPPTQDTCEPVQTTAQKKSEAEKAAEKVLSDYKGKAIAFGKTSVVCGAGQWDKPADKKCYKIPDAYGYATAVWATAATGASLKGNALDFEVVGDSKCTGTKGALQSCYHVRGADVVRAASLWASYVNTVGSPAKADEIDDKLCWPDSLHCNVNAFELPQDVKIDDGTLPWMASAVLTPIDWMLAWIGATGDPKYLVYYEKFPEEAEAWWTYSKGDPLWTVAATGAALSLAPGALKVAGTAAFSVTKGGAKVLYKSIVRRSLTDADKALINHEMKVAMSDSLARNFGGKAAKAYLRALEIEGTFVGDTVNKGVNQAIKDKLKAKADSSIIAGETQWIKVSGNDNAMAELSYAVRGEGTIESDFVKDVLKRNGLQDVTDEEIDKITSDLVQKKTEAKAGNLFSQSEFKAAMTKVVASGDYQKDYAERFDIKVQMFETALNKDKNNGKIGVVPALKWAWKKLNKKGAEESFTKEQLDSGYASYFRIESSLSKIPEDLSGSNLAGLTEEQVLDGMFKTGTGKTKITVSQIISNLKAGATSPLDAPARAELDAIAAAWYNAEGDMAIKRTYWQKAEQMLKGSTGGIPSKKRIAILAGTYLAADYFMYEESKADKYKVQQNTVTLYYPRMWAALLGDDPAKGNYPVKAETKSVKQDTWVQMKIPEVADFGGGGMPLALASPCKADIKVTWGEDCKCENYFGDDTIGYRFDKIACVLDLNKNGKVDDTSEVGSGMPDKQGEWISVDLASDAKCPAEYNLASDLPSASLPGGHDTVPAGKYPVLPRIYNPSDFYNEVGALSLSETFGSFDDCKVPGKKDISLALQECVKKRAYNADGTVKLDEYKGCYDAGGCTPMSAFNSNIPIFVSYGGMRTASSQAMNVAPYTINVFTSADGTPTTYKMCTKQGLKSWIETFATSTTVYDTKCVKIEVDKESMTQYLKDNPKMDKNFCRENKAMLIDYALWIGEGAVATATIAASIWGTPIAGEAVGAAGSAITAIGWKVADESKLWPNNQD